MKVLNIEAKSKLKDEDFFIDENFISRLPEKVFLAYLVQFKKQAEAMKKALEKSRKVVGFQQVLGCTKLKTPHQIVLIGNGRFHALNLASQNKLPIILYSNGSSIIIGGKDIAELQKKKQASLNRFLSSASIGIIVSTKPGQEKMAEARALKERIAGKFPEKQVFIFISNTVRAEEFENFNIDFWINTACPRLAEDSSRMANADDIEELL